MHITLSDKDAGLVGYWGFEDAGNIAMDLSPNRSDGEMIGDAHLMEAELPAQSELHIPTVISGIVKDDSGKPVPYAWVRLEKDGEEITKTQVDESGKYRIVVLPSVSGLYDLSATARREDMGDWQVEIEDGLAHNDVRGINRDLDGFLWFGTEGGVSLYDGEQFVNFTQKDGLAGNQVHALH